MMKVTPTVNGKVRKVVLELDLLPKASERPSASGRTIIMATAQSAYDHVIDGHPVKIQVNIYRKNPDAG